MKKKKLLSRVYWILMAMILSWFPAAARYRYYRSALVLPSAINRIPHQFYSVLSHPLMIEAFAAPRDFLGMEKVRGLVKKPQGVTLTPVFCCVVFLQFVVEPSLSTLHA